jgi:TRAP-type C4-dicarboxylate transport system permease small subunit
VSFFLAYRRANDYLEMALYAMAVAIMLFIVLAIFAAAATRYLTGIGYDWLAELPAQLVPWVVFPMLGVLLRRGLHLSVDVVSYVASERHMTLVQLGVAVVCLVTSAVFVVAGINAVSFFRMLNQYSTTELRFPLWWLYVAFPAGFLIAANYSLELLLDAVLRMTGRHVPQLDATP